MRQLLYKSQNLGVSLISPERPDRIEEAGYMRIQFPRYAPHLADPNRIAHEWGDPLHQLTDFVHRIEKRLAAYTCGETFVVCMSKCLDALSWRWGSRFPIKG